MSISDSKLTGLNREQIFQDTWWLEFCLCGGLGFSTKKISEPLIGSEVKQLCLHSTCVTAELNPADGVFAITQVMCCLTEHFQVPPMTGAPKKCLCCKKKPKEGDTPSDEFQGDLYDIATIFDSTFWLYYFMCCGVGVNIPGKDRPIFVQKYKQLWCRQTTKLVPVVEGGVLCSGLSTACCLWEQCEFPCIKKGPIVACCGFKKDWAAANGS